MTHLQHLRLLASAFVSILLLSATVSAQQTPPEIEWQRSFGGRGSEEASSIQQTIDGGYIVAGQSNSKDGDVTGNHGLSHNSDIWIVKLTSVGDIQWQRSLGGSNEDQANSLAQTTDGGYIVAGWSLSNDGDVTGWHGNSDYWIVKLTSTGGLEWQKSLGGSDLDYAYSIAQTSDGGYIVAGSSYSNNGDVAGHHESSVYSDYWVVKLTSTGQIEWQKSLGGSFSDYAYSIAQTSDGGYIVGGHTTSIDGDVTGLHGYSPDYWIVKLTSTGEIEWQKSLGGSYNDQATSIQQASDGGYIVAGRSASTNGNVTGHHGSYEYADYWIVKLTNIGGIEWQRSLGGRGSDEARSIAQTSDGGYIVAGNSKSTNGDVTGHHGLSDYSDYWIVKLTSAGQIEWQKSLGGSGHDGANSIEQTSDGGYIVAGRSASTNGDVTGHHGLSDTYDYWIVKLAPATSDVNLQPEPASNIAAITVIPNPAHNTTVLKITSTAEAEYTIELISSIGEVVKRQSVHLGIGEQEVQLRDMEVLPAGSYEVIVSRSKTPVARGRVVVVGK